jgi:hypothetical protein
MRRGRFRRSMRSFNSGRAVRKINVFRKGGTRL